MRRWPIVALLVAGTLGLAVVTPHASAVAAPAATPGPCAGADGVTVVVDATTLGGGVRVGCAPGSPASGLEALRSAGFEVRGTARFPGFVCRIDGAPAADPCLDTAAADAYWSYWHAARGGRWTYSDTGAAERTPPVGTVEGWVFSDGSGRSPALAPPAPAPPVTTPSTPITAAAPAAVAGITTLPAPGAPTPPATGPGPSSAGTPLPGSGAPGAPPGATPGAPPGATPPAAASVPGSTPAGGTGPDDGEVTAGADAGTDAGTDASGTVGPGAAGPTDERAVSPDPGVDTGASGSPAATLVGLVVVAAVAGAAVVTVRRRRAGPEAP